MRLHRDDRFSPSRTLTVVFLLLAATQAAGQPPLERPDFAIPRYHELAADTVRTAVGTIPHAADHVRWVRHADLGPLTRPGLTAGLTARDLDGDGDVDLFFARQTLLAPRLGAKEGARAPDGSPLPGSAIAWNEGQGRWRSVPSPTSGPSVAAHEWADLDLDGDLDLVARTHASAAGGHRVEVWRHEDRTFTAWPLDPPVAEVLAVARAFTVGDVDGDGLLDLVVATGDDVVRLAGADLERAARTSFGDEGLPPNVALQVLDLGGDGRTEIVVHDVDPFWARRDVAFVIEADGNLRREDGPLAMPLLSAPSRADVDGDGRLDLFFGQSDYFGGRNTLLLATDEGFVPHRQKSGLFAGYAYTNGAVWADLDHDGRLDLFQPRFAAASRPIRSELFVQLASGAEGPRFGALRGEADPGVVGASRTAVWFDLEGDGDLDLLVGRMLDYSESGPWESTRDLVFENVSTVGSWLQVDLVGSARTVRGARVDVHAGGDVVTRFVGEGGTRGRSANPLRLHFGLGDARRVDRIEVHWPDGTREAWPGGPVDRRVRLRNGTAPGGR